MASSPGTIRFPDVVSTPPAPPSGYAFLYIKANVLYILDSGAVETAIGSASSITALTGDVTAVGPGSVPATVAFVGTSSASNVHLAELAANAATSSNTASTIVKRDGSGNFSAGTISAALSGNATTATNAGSFTGSLSGDVTGTQSATVVSFVGTSSAATVHTAELAANAATAANTASTIVKRDASGDFFAGTITAALTGNVLGNLTGNVTGNASGSSATFTGSLVGDVTGTQGATVVSTVGGSTAANIASAEALANAATSVNTPSTIIKRDGSGNFSAGTISAALTGNVTGNVSGSSASFTGSLSGDVTGTQGATVVSTVGTSSAANINTAEIAANAATASNTVSTIVKRDGSGNFAAGTITAALTGSASNNVLRAGDTMTGALREAVVALTDAATITTDASLGNVFTVTLGGNRTLGAPTNPTNGQKIIYRFRQDGTGNRTLAFNAIFRFGIDIVATTLSTGANKTDYIGMIYNSADTAWDVIAVSKGF